MTAPNTPRRKAEKHQWTPAEIALLHTRYPTTLTAILAAELGISINAINNAAFKRGIKKTAEYKSALTRSASHGVGNRFGAPPVFPEAGMTDLVAGMRGFEADHAPDGWPAIRMRQISALCDEIERLRGAIEDGMNIMHRLPDRPDWIAPFPARAHHAKWCSDVTHPDIRLMASAPDLLEALQELRYACTDKAEAMADAAIAKALGNAIVRGGSDGQ